MLGINGTTGALKYLRNISPNGIVTVDPTYRYDYYAGLSSGHFVIYAYQINQTNGELAKVPGSPFPTNSTSKAYEEVTFADAKGEFLFLVEADDDNNLYLSVFRVNRTTGALSQTNRIFVTNEYINGRGYVVADPSEKYVYYGYDGYNAPNWISAYALDTTNGTLTEVPGSPFSAPSMWGGGIKPVGHFLYTLSGSGTQGISGFAINEQTGALTQVSGSPFNDPLAITMAVDPVNSLIYTGNGNGGGFSCTQNAIDTFRINMTTGKLSRIATSGTAGLNCPAVVTADPSGKFVYVGGMVDLTPGCQFDECYGATSSFRVDPATGKLTVVTKEYPYPGGNMDATTQLTVIR